MHHVFKYVGEPSSAISEGSIVTIDIPTAIGAVKELYIRFLTATGAESTAQEIRNKIKKIRLLIDEKAYIDASPADLEDCINRYYSSRSATGGIVVLPLIMRHLESPKTAEHLQLGTLGVGSIKIEIECAQATDITTAKVYAIRADYDCLPGVIRSIKTVTGIAIGATGDNIVTQDIASVNTAQAIIAVHISKSGGALSQLGLMINGSERLGVIPYALIGESMAQAGRDISPDWYSVDLLGRNLLEDQLAIGGITGPMAGLKQAYSQKPVASVNLVTNWTTKPTGDATRAVIETLTTVPVTV